ncbi:putative L-threonine-O-3-phosphate decarboxylase [Alkaliphilus metalliredigens QYMF]|uniref:threonine-phosphate decarboxylase n=1 Tax=Alkaliphilus metalliredigens (strain QYMF) TaxID=293826 RepID=A6TU68_ALKMQ|nr:threonine-phosphate decarboxylase CobD [Alkaliphilus metalliredigens]ABR49736.1 putative L-threonine-O-3-phosphate decarboxylase [Alkaliphilus metalliredigens QYMF]
MRHGGNIVQVEREKSIGAGKILDYSANINPMGVPESFQKIIQEKYNDLCHYPDIDYHHLRFAIGHYYGIQKEDVLVGNGAAQLIFDFIRVLKPQRALILAPTFGEYERALKAFDCDVIRYYLREENSFQINIESLLESLTDSIDLIILCNPNNPTGNLISKEDLKRVVTHCEDKKIKVMIDEAFIDFVGENERSSVLKWVEQYKELIVIRAFTKYFGMPGIRLGFGVCGDKGVQEQMTDTMIPWSVNTFASFFGEVLLNDKVYVEKTKSWLKHEKPRFMVKLKEIKGMKVYPSTANFVLIKLMDSSLSIDELKEKLLERYIMIRDCSNFQGLGEQFFRIAIKDEQSNEKFIQVLSEILS